MKALLKNIYRFIPFKKELFSGLKLIWTPSESTFRHLHFVGVFKVRLNDSASFKMKHYGYQLENEIFWSGIANGWEKESLKLWTKLCEKSEVILDIGANTGIYSLIAKSINPEAKVYAFEPVDRIFSKLQNNISLNNFDIIPIHKAASNTNGSAVIYDIPAEHLYSVTVNKNPHSSETTVIETKIETITLDTFVRQHNLQKIDLIKIDVETHEPEVLEGFSGFLAQFKPALLLEVLNDEVGERINRIVHKLGYIYFNIDERGGVRKVNKITQSDYYNYLLCSEEAARELKLL